MRRIILIIVVSLFIGANSVYSQSTNKAGTTAAQFLKIGIGAKQIAMGGASAGFVNDESAMYWNPAGLAEVKRISFYTSHTNWFADLQHNYFGFIIPVSNNQTLGINATMLTMDEMEITTELDPQGTGEFFEASDIAVGVTYSMQLVDFFSFGGTVKFISQSIYNESATAFAVDLGTRLNTGYAGIKIGMSFTNFGTKMKLEGRDLRKTYDPNPNNASNVGVNSNLDTESWELPVNFRVGIGWDVASGYDALLISNEHQLHFAADANHPNDAPENISLGMEYTWRKLLSLRSGYHFNDDVRNWVAGVGIVWSIPNAATMGVDYAFQNLDKLGEVHSFTVSLRL